MQVILLARTKVRGEMRQPGELVMPDPPARGVEWVKAGCAAWPRDEAPTPATEADAAILAACQGAEWDAGDVPVLLLPRAPLVIGGDFRGAHSVASLPAHPAALLIQAGEAVALPPAGPLGPHGLRLPRPEGEPLADFMADAVDGDRFAAALGPPAERLWSGDGWDGRCTPAAETPAKLTREEVEAEPMPPMNLARVRALAAGSMPYGVSPPAGNAHNWPNLRQHSTRLWGLTRPDWRGCERVRYWRMPLDAVAAEEAAYMTAMRQTAGHRRRAALRVELFAALRSGAVVASAMDARDRSRQRVPVPLGWWGDTLMVVEWKRGASELRPSEPQADLPRFRDITLAPAGAAAPLRNVTADPSHEAPPRRKGGRPPKWDRVKIGNRLREIANTPDGLPSGGAELRDLVRRICAELTGEEPADSTLAEIMDDLELR